MSRELGNLFVKHIKLVIQSLLIQNKLSARPGMNEFYSWAKDGFDYLVEDRPGEKRAAESTTGWI
jgi:hypothetical protein